MYQMRSLCRRPQHGPYKDSAPRPRHAPEPGTLLPRRDPGAAPHQPHRAAPYPLPGAAAYRRLEGGGGLLGASLTGAPSLPSSPNVQLPAEVTRGPLPARVPAPPASPWLTGRKDPGSSRLLDGTRASRTPLTERPRDPGSRGSRTHGFFPGPGNCLLPVWANIQRPPTRPSWEVALPQLALLSIMLPEVVPRRNFLFLFPSVKWDNDLYQVRQCERGKEHPAMLSLLPGALVCPNPGRQTPQVPTLQPPTCQKLGGLAKLVWRMWGPT